MISLHNYRILKGENAESEILTIGNEDIFQTFDLTIPEKKEKKTEELQEKAAEEKAYEPPPPDPAEMLMQETIRKTEALLESAKREAEEIKAQAYKEGFAQGEQDGREEGRRLALEEEQAIAKERIHEMENKIAQYVTDMGNQKDKILEEYLDDLKNISLAIGEKIVQTSLKSSSEVIKKMIIAATEKLKKTAWAKIYVAGSNEMDLQGDAQLLRELSKLSDNVKIVMMDDTEPGTCIIELPHEIIDISASSQMENIRDILNNART